jgi:peptide/nickel transport system substrate-binding protein
VTINFSSWYKKLHSFSRNRIASLQRQKDEWNAKLVTRVTREKHLPNWKQMKQLSQFLSLREKRLLKGFISVAFVASLLLGYNIYRTNSELIPTNGGEYIEGVIGKPQFINPVLAGNNETDSDVTRLVYSSLLRFGLNLELVPDAAESYTVSEDQKQYTVRLKENILWHDGERLTVDDIIFTVEMIKNPQIFSPLQSNFRGVSIERVDEHSVRFILKEPYAPFLNSLTFGILPLHKWGNIEPKNFPLAKMNLEPVGSGPFKASALKQDEFGDIRSYTLVRNDQYYGRKPYIEKITFKFFSNIEAAVDALAGKGLLGISFLPRSSRAVMEKNKNLKYYSSSLPQYTALFYNLRDSEILKQKAIRKALTMAIDRETLTNNILQGAAETIYSPILPGNVGYSTDLAHITFNQDEANKILDAAGWKRISPKEYYDVIQKNKIQAEREDTNNENSGEGKVSIAVTDASTKNDDETSTENVDTENPVDENLLETLKQQEFYRKKGNTILELNITTVDQSEYRAVAEKIQEDWRRIGARVDLFSVETNKMNSEVIIPRLYNVLLYGEVVGPDPDPYPYWHSSQNTNGGLNLSLYSNKKVDVLLEDARLTHDTEKRSEYYREFQQILIEDVPAAFLYSPEYQYAVDSQVKNIAEKKMFLPQDRFSDIEEWYMKTKKVFHWKGLKSIINL